MKIVFLLLCPFAACIQEFIEEPSNIEVNPGELIVLPCLIRNKAGECRWEKDGTPVGMYEDKYEWAGNVLSGDCGLVISDASVEYDTGAWLCQVTASDFTQKDTLISREVRINVRGKLYHYLIHEFMQPKLQVIFNINFSFPEESVAQKHEYARHRSKTE